MRARLLAAALAVLLMAGCETRSPSGRASAAYPIGDRDQSISLIDSSYAAAEVLIANAGRQLDPANPILVSTVVNIDSLETSTTLGRLISEHVSGRFTKAGFRMVELKLQNSVYMKRNEGELMLSRHFLDIANSHRAQAVVVGTYGQGQQNVYVNLKLVQPEQNFVLAAHDYAIPITPDVRSLIRGTSGRSGW